MSGFSIHRRNNARKCEGLRRYGGMSPYKRHKIFYQLLICSSIRVRERRGEDWALVVLPTTHNQLRALLRLLSFVSFTTTHSASIERNLHDILRVLYVSYPLIQCTERWVLYALEHLSSSAPRYAHCMMPTQQYQATWCSLPFDKKQLYCWCRIKSVAVCAYDWGT